MSNPTSKRNQDGAILNSGYLLSLEGTESSISSGLENNKALMMLLITNVLHKTHNSEISTSVP